MSGDSSESRPNWAAEASQNLQAEGHNCPMQVTQITAAYLVEAAAAAHQGQCGHETSHVLGAGISLFVHKGVDSQLVEGLHIELPEG